MNDLTPIDSASITAIAEDVFAAMVDGEHGHLTVHDGPMEVRNPLFAWVEMHSEDFAARAVLMTDTATAHELARALLAMEPHEPVNEADLVDALGEVANVVGGNLKSLLPTQGSLTLPEVGTFIEDSDDAVNIDAVTLAWRGRLLDITVWQL